MRKNKGLTTFKFILLSTGLGMLVSGCCDCNKPVPAPKTVFVKEYHVGGDMINIEGDNNDVNFTKGNGNNVASRSGGTQNQGRVVKPRPKPVKKPVVQPEPEPKPEPEPEPKPEVVEKHCTVVITYQTPCNGR
ncbi:MAG: hypothetical protein J6T27_04615 [Alphaproteobacteria bacterium]|nr:hypothetical protein [Alphaproteobacteria bacterium]